MEEPQEEQRRGEELPQEEEGQPRKVAIITGSTSGIGLETAKALYLRGFHVVMGTLSGS